MNGLGTVIDILAIIVGGSIGMIFCGKLKVSYQKILLQAIGLGAILFGFHGAWNGLFVLDGNKLEVEGTILVVFALSIGLLLGIAFRMDRILERVGNAFQRLVEHNEKPASSGKSGKNAGRPVSSAERHQAIRMAREAGRAQNGTGRTHSAPGGGKKERVRLSELPTYKLDETNSGSLFTDGFIIATLICACNGLAFSGAYADTVSSDVKVLLIKAVFDALFVFALSTVYGSGTIFSALPVLIIQGIVTLVGITATELLSDTLIHQLSLIGSIMTIGAGINLCFGKRWRVANLLPSLLISPLYGLIIIIVERIMEK